jgi:hypothetical protein
MSTSERTSDAKNFPDDVGAEVQFKILAERVARTADADLKEFLSGILKATETTLADLNAMRERLDKAQADAQAATAAAQKAKQDAGESAVKSDIRAEALAAGAVDPADVLPFISLSAVALDENGKSNIAELIGALKQQKPHLFRKVSTSAAHPVPKPGNAAPRNALEMTAGEYRAAKARFVRR